MNIDLTDREVELLMTALGTHIGTLRAHPNVNTPVMADLINELFELEDDLREMVNRQDDGWGDAETQMFNAGVEARERMKAASRAAVRKAVNFQKAPKRDLSETQTHDVFDDASWNPDDPRNW